MTDEIPTAALLKAVKTLIDEIENSEAIDILQDISDVKQAVNQLEANPAQAMIDPSPETQKVDGGNTNTVFDLPDRIWVDASDMSIHASDGDGRVAYVIEPAPKRHERYKSDAEVTQIRDLAQQGLSQKQIAETLGINPRTVRKFAGRIYGQHPPAKSPSQVRDTLEAHYG